MTKRRFLIIVASWSVAYALYLGNLWRSHVSLLAGESTDERLGWFLLVAGGSLPWWIVPLCLALFLARSSRNSEAAESGAAPGAPAVHSTDGRKGRTRWQVRGALLGAGAVVALDAIYGSYLVSILVCPVWTVAALVRCFFRSDGRRIATANLAIPIAALALSSTNATLQARIARQNAGLIIDAAERYRSATGGYPRSLSDLVPLYLPNVPRAKYAYGGTFRYWEFEGNHTLMWVEVPPFGRPFYRFEEARWGYAD